MKLKRKGKRYAYFLWGGKQLNYALFCRNLQIYSSFEAEESLLIASPTKEQSNTQDVLMNFLRKERSTFMQRSFGHNTPVNGFKQ